MFSRSGNARNGQQQRPLPPAQQQQQSGNTMSNNQQTRYHMVPGGDAAARASPAGRRMGASPLSPSSGSHNSSDSYRRNGSGSNDDGGQDLGPYSHLKKGSGRGMAANGLRNGAVAQNGYGQGQQRPTPTSYAGAPSLNSGRTTANSGRPGPGGLSSGTTSLSDRSASSQYNSNGSVSDRKMLFDTSPQSNYLLASKNEAEADDYLHNPDARGRKDTRFICCSPRGFLNVFVLMVLVCGLLALFAGYPIISHFTTRPASTMGAYGIGGTNGTGQVPIVVPQIRLKDPDTPANAQKWTSPVTRDSYHLVFSDEFEVEGRTFWPNDDPFWEAANIWYGATGDYEWYTPEQINTTNGYLQITLEDKPMHNLNFRSGMLQSWNKFCFQGGYIEFSVVLPGAPTEVGWWPGLWTMGNLARPGYLGTTDGMWPYSYDSCDSGILQNQTAPGRQGYNSVSTYTGSGTREGLNWLNGQRASACTCAGEDHPGPSNNVGRAAPELDILEAQIKQQSIGEVSQSVQVAPFDLRYDWDTTASTIYNEALSDYNPYKGGVYQEAGSALTRIPNTAYARTGNQFHTFGVDYTPDWNGDGSGSVTWYMDGVATWTVTGAAFPARPAIDISQRLIPVEPMSIIMNLGLSRGFQSDLDFTTLTYPAVMKVDYVRVYQSDSNKQDLVSCDPADHPTSKYIQDHIEVYTNPNHTVWPLSWPKDRITGC